MTKRIYTRGNVEVQNIKVGDIHYEFEYGCYIKCKVISLPISTPNSDGTPYWTWKSEYINTDGTMSGKIIDYGVDPEYSHYSSKLYDHEAYAGCQQI